MPAPIFDNGTVKIRVFQEQAAHIGGDFYAYHEVSDGGLLVAVGDASGKGIPAALESARVCTLISLKAQSCGSDALQEWLADLNNAIQATAERAGSLTTLAVLLIDGRRRRLYASSFGQFRPRYLSAENRWEELACPVHAPLGVFAAQSFAAIGVPLAIGKQWLLLTDGFVEARDSVGVQFGESALAKALSRATSEQTDPLHVLENQWREFSEHGPDRDDATALLLIDSSPRPLETCQCDISPETIPDLRSFCEQWAAFAGFSEAEVYQVVLACDEILTNVYKHAYHSGSGSVRCDASVDATSLRFLVTHWGDGLSSDANIACSPARFKAGGYGLPFIRQVFDEVHFERSKEFSTVSFSKRLFKTG
jgi:anti-sigma regulatory factor (Ser/Thr protein kinase)